MKLINSIHILVAEDDNNIRTGVVDTLESEGYKVTEACNGMEAIKRFETERFDLLLLDIMMPEKSGFDVCMHIRKKNENLPIIMLTAKGEEIDKVMGLKLGADDYITKPFGINELLARIAAVLRRCKREIISNDKQITRSNEKTVAEKNEKPFSSSCSEEIACADNFDFADMIVNTSQYKLIRKDKNIDLSQREIKLLRIFHDHPGEVLSRDRLLNDVWGIDYYGTTRTLDQHIAQLRKKVENDPSLPRVITTVHGVGYRYNSKANV
ncbi:Transcriptional regulatory protein YycF [Desulfamplus magnetovallimortis]|uniref:Transcriptional regulatory protein YycF n=1 Tax=Desulfamplus magnetovallimortis TaxID=1246637 RepID=A0A1W1HG02_9BACT|nr:response regulator transcription factor [Desulfamplus magnetovallimortis]SLM31312.1 Transcriptional regulatory protein YycF [Desulfamplus magnetovallimortis]